ncbi:hypothetical protein [Paenibacillus chitinolyticus]
MMRPSKGCNFYREIIMYLSVVEVVWGMKFYCKDRMGLDVENIEHPLIKDLFPVIEGLIEVDTDPVFSKVVEYI